MNDYILVKPDDLSSRNLGTLVRKAEHAVKMARSAFDESTWGHCWIWGGETYELFSSHASASLGDAHTKLLYVKEKLDNLAKFLDSGPDAMQDIDRRYKSEMKEWRKDNNHSGVVWTSSGGKTGREEVSVDSANGNIKNNASYPGSVIVNENPDYPSNRGLHVVPEKTNAPGRRNRDAYNEVLDSFDVEHRARYQNGSDGNTWCNIYVSDVTYAMGCEIPHYYDPETGAPLPSDAPGGRYTSAAGIRDWLSTYGEQYGWIACDADTAQAMANQGYPSMACDTSGAHVAMISPQREGDPGIMLSQAGKYIFRHKELIYGWNPNNYTLKYYYHP